MFMTVTNVDYTFGAAKLMNFWHKPFFVHQFCVQLLTHLINFDFDTSFFCMTQLLTTITQILNCLMKNFKVWKVKNVVVHCCSRTCRVDRAVFKGFVAEESSSWCCSRVPKLGQSWIVPMIVLVGGM